MNNKAVVRFQTITYDSISTLKRCIWKITKKSRSPDPHSNQAGQLLVELTTFCFQKQQWKYQISRLFCTPFYIYLHPRSMKPWSGWSFVHYPKSKDLLDQSLDLLYTEVKLKKKRLTDFFLLFLFLTVSYYFNRQ
jgi:hypothetical protein